MSTDAISSLDLYIKAASEKKALNLIVQRTVQPPGECDC